ncbi:transcription termination/antitermination protein NusG [Hordeum vulgare subsp. vulgare]|uniref:NusG-like N-terminal domain-containing protein n=1 Tax=Hordeum vulgare subsp. vulgare TaxID=112509 RepID=A0A8I6XYY9_HORVV|nr:transcription termination/antitermination protein NusG [Hordeum vulgare subsp. vulgare]
MSLVYPLLRLPCRCALPAAPRAAAASVVSLSASASVSSADGGGDGDEELTARERRERRREARELKARDWKEEVEEQLIHEPARRRKKPPKRTWREELNLDFLAEHGPQWWLVRVSMAPGTDYVDLITKAVARRFSEVSFKIYNPAIQVKKRLKSGLISTKSKPLHPGLVFLYCTLNKELHDFIRDTEGCYGFIGATRGSIKRQIKKPKPIPAEEVESIIKKEKEEQEKVDKEFEDLENWNNVGSFSKPVEDSELMLINKIKKQVKKSTSKGASSNDTFTLGASVHVLSGPFAGFTGSLLEVIRKNKKVTVQMTLFGKESFVDLDFDQIEALNT